MNARTDAAMDTRTVGRQSGRDLEHTARALSAWLSERLRPAGDVTVFDLAWPEGAGLSNETILLRARWIEDRRPVEQGLVVRLAPSRIQIFMDADLRTQYDLLKALHDGGHVKVAEPLWYEADASVLGQPFFVMRRLEGRVPVSFPSYNVSGFLFDATPKERAVAWHSAMEEFCRIAVTPMEAVRLLAMPQTGPTGFDQHLAYWKKYRRWTGADASPFLSDAEAWLDKHRPKNPASGLSWGDARIGNMIFGPDFRLTGVMDWEQASLGGPMHDLCWWLHSDEMRASGMGAKRLEGMGSPQETVALWQELTGFKVQDLEWHEAFTAFKFALIVTRFQAIQRNERPGNNMNNNPHTRQIAKIMGVDQPGDGFLNPQ